MFNVSRTAVITGCAAGVMFAFGWMARSAFETTLILSLVGGLSGVFAQIATREMSAKAQALIETAMQQYTTDGGEGLDAARQTRSRIANLGLLTLVAGALAPAASAVRSLFDSGLWTALAWSMAAIAFTLGVQLFRANQELALVIEAHRIAKLREKSIRDAVAERKPFDPSVFQTSKG